MKDVEGLELSGKWLAYMDAYREDRKLHEIGERDKKKRMQLCVRLSIFHFYYCLAIGNAISVHMAYLQEI